MSGKLACEKSGMLGILGSVVQGELQGECILRTEPYTAQLGSQAAHPGVRTQQCRYG